MTLEAMLTQLGYSENDTLRSQMQKAIDNTHGYEKISKHIADLHTELKAHGGHIALSNSVNNLKIKNESEFEKERQEVKNRILAWSEKYKVELQKVEGKETYYILGFKFKAS